MSGRQNQPVADSLIGGHRGDIESLRAVAVVAVLLYHAGVPGFSGGYVGVDVFFALSGYLMTGLLAAEHRRAGSIDFGAFYARRARRLLPASALVLVVTTLSSALILAPLAMKRVAGDAMWAGAYAVNLRFAREATDYLGADVAESPVLHYWSLAVEEQFYLVWPVLLAIGLRRTVTYHRSVVFLATLSIVSFGIAIWMTADSQPWAFFGLPARAWEFGLGGLGAFAGVRYARATEWVRLATFVVGMTAIMVAVFTFDATTRFPGPWAIVPVIGTVLVLVSRRTPSPVDGGEVGLGRRLDRWFTSSVAQWIGGRSYAIYLWHWPPLVLVPVALGRPLTVPENVGVVLAASIVAVVAHDVVENPIRFSKRLASRSRSGALALALTSAAIVVPAVVGSRTSLSVGTGVSAVADDVVRDADEARPLPVNVTPSLDEVGEDRPRAAADGCHVGQRDEEPLTPCAYGDLDARRTMVLFGDSHMVQWFPAFEEYGLEHGWKIVVLTKTGCPSLALSVRNENFGRDYTECDAWRVATVAEIRRLRPDVVVLGNYPRGPTADASEAERSAWHDQWTMGLRSIVDELDAFVGRVVLLGPTPVPPGSVPECVSGNMADTRACDLDRASRAPQTENDRQRDAAATEGIGFVEVTDWLCGATTCPSVIGPVLAYRDASHISTDMARSLVPRLADGLAAIGIE